MKLPLVIIASMCIILSSCSGKGSFEKENSAVAQDSYIRNESKIEGKIQIIYARFGVQKGIFHTNINGIEPSRGYQGEYDKADGTKNGIVFYTKYEGNEGIYLTNLSANNPKLILKGYMLESKPSINPEGTLAAFLAYSLKDYKIQTYLANLKDLTVQKLDLGEEIRDIAFLDDEYIVYSKKIQVGDKSIFQIFKYSLKRSAETRLIISEYNDINPIVSRNKRSIAFLSDRNKKYNLYILNTDNGSIESIDVNDAVVGGTMNWSNDGKYIVCITLNGGSRDKIKLSDIESQTVEDIDKGYIASFSPDSKYLIYASYSAEQETKKQILYKRKVGTDKSEIILEFPEEGKYSKSINMLYTIDN